MKKNILVILALLLISLFFLINFQKYNVLIPDDDYWVPFYGTFTLPMEGRYISSSIAIFLINKLSYLLNIHPNDLQNTIVAYFKSVVLIIIICFTALSAFFFRKNNKEHFLAKTFSWDFILIYITSFLLIFNNQGLLYQSHIISDKCKYFHFYANILETAGFLEYILGSLFYIILSLFLIKIFTKQDIEIKKPEKIFICIISLCCGLSVEILNIPMLLTQTAFLIYCLIKHKIKPIKNMFYPYIILFLSFIFYYWTGYTIGFNHHKFDILLDIQTILTAQQETTKFFISEFFKLFIYPNIILFISLILITVYLIIRKPGSKRNSDFIILNTLNIFSLLCSYFFIGHFSLISENIDLLNEQYFTSLILILFADLLLLISFALDTDEKISIEKSSIIKIIFCCLILSICSKDLITNYYKNYNDTIQLQKQHQEASYNIEKYILDNKNAEVIKVPKYYKIYQTIIFYKIIHNPTLDNTKFYLTDDAHIEMKHYTNKLKFTDLLEHRIQKYDNYNKYRKNIYEN